MSSNVKTINNFVYRSFVDKTLTKEEPEVLGELTQRTGNVQAKAFKERTKVNDVQAERSRLYLSKTPPSLSELNFAEKNLLEGDEEFSDWVIEGSTSSASSSSSSSIPQSSGVSFSSSSSLSVISTLGDQIPSSHLLATDLCGSQGKTPPPESSLNTPATHAVDRACALKDRGESNPSTPTRQSASDISSKIIKLPLPITGSAPRSNPERFRLLYCCASRNKALI